jgi:hypothetical protein
MARLMVGLLVYQKVVSTDELLAVSMVVEMDLPMVVH